MVRSPAVRLPPEAKGTQGVTDRPEILMTPGPTPVPPEVLLAQGSPLVYHRGPGFGAVLREVTDGLRHELVKVAEDLPRGRIFAR